MLPHSVWAQEIQPPQAKEVRGPITTGGQVLKPMTKDEAKAFLEDKIYQAIDADDFGQQLRLAEMLSRIDNGENIAMASEVKGPTTPQVLECAVSLPFGPPGWVIGGVCAVVSIVVGLGVGVLIMMVIDSGSGPQTLYYATDVGVQHIESEVTLATDLGDLTVDLSQYPFDNPDWEPLIWFATAETTMDLAVASQKELQGAFRGHLDKHREAERVYREIFEATGGGYHSPPGGDPDDPDDWSRFLCYTARTWRKLDLIGGVINKIRHDRVMMMLRDPVEGFWRVIVVGTPVEPRFGRWITYTSKAFLVTAYETNYRTIEYLFGIMEKYARLGFSRCAIEDVDPLPPPSNIWPPPAGAFRMYMPMTPSEGWATQAATP